MKKIGLKSSLATMGILVIALLFLGSCNKKEAPSAPTNLTAELDGDCIHLSWKEVPNADYYRITVGFHIRNQNNELGEIYEVFLCETADHTYNDHYPFDGMNYYKIEAVNEYGISSYSEVSCHYSSTGNDIHEINPGIPENAEGVALFPNPAKNRVFIGHTDSFNHIMVENILGQMVLDFDLCGTALEINIIQLETGIYLAHLYSEDGEVVKRFVVAHE